MSTILKHSSQREALLKLLKSVDCHPSAEWLYSELKRDMPRLSLGTVYRNLGVLCERGEAIQLNVGDGTVHYDANTRDHNHLFCTECRKLYDLGGDDMSDIDRTLAQKYDVSIASHSFVFYGLCRECNKYKKN